MLYRESQVQSIMSSWRG